MTRLRVVRLEHANKIIRESSAKFRPQGFPGYLLLRCADVWTATDLLNLKKRIPRPLAFPEIL